MYRAVGAENMVAYYVLTAVAVLFFPLGLYFHRTSSWTSTLCHGMVHVVANAGNVVLYAGAIAK